MDKCVNCKKLWIGISIGFIVVLLIGIGIFDFELYEKNGYFIFDLIRFGFIIAISLGSLIGCEKLIRMYCKDDDEINLVFGILLGAVAVVCIMILIYYLPPAAQEAEFRMMYESNDIDKLANRIYGLDCDKFLDNFNYLSKGFGYYSQGYNYVITHNLIIKKYEECK